MEGAQQAEVRLLAVDVRSLPLRPSHGCPALAAVAMQTDHWKHPQLHLPQNRWQPSVQQAARQQESPSRAVQEVETAKGAASVCRLARHCLLLAVQKVTWHRPLRSRQQKEFSNPRKPCRSCQIEEAAPPVELSYLAFNKRHCGCGYQIAHTASEIRKKGEKSNTRTRDQDSTPIIDSSQLAAKMENCLKECIPNHQIRDNKLDFMLTFQRRVDGISTAL